MQREIVRRESHGTINFSENVPTGKVTMRGDSQAPSEGLDTSQEDLQVCANTERISKNIYYQGALTAAQGRSKGQNQIKRRKSWTKNSEEKSNTKTKQQTTLSGNLGSDFENITVKKNPETTTESFH